MDHPDDDDHAGKNEIKTLLVRHLPAELSPADKEDLLKYFGAESVKVLSNHGPLKHTAFATFRSNNAATKALGRLHQLKILDHTLVVTFAKKEDNFTILKDPPLSDKLKPIKKEQKKHAMQKPKVPVLDNGIAPALGLNYQPNPTLKYLYPPLSPAILTNISHVLMTVPKFYVQVLHLMNKMNLPCPFGQVTPRPPLFECLPHAPPMPAPPPFPPDYPPLPERDVDPASEEESEYESEDDEDKERIARLMGLVNQACKRPLRLKTSSKRKKPKIKDLLYAPKLDSQSAPAMQPSDVFEQPNAAAPKKIEFHIGVQEVAAIVEGSEPGQVSQHHESSAEQEMDDDSCKEAPDGFGKLYPSTKASGLQEEGSDEEADLPSDVISRKELEKGRLSKDEMKRMSVYKNYEAGEPTCRLYVKNIAKQVEEKDLKYIYGRYIDLSSEAERNMFDIVLMKEGRMKGQAFVGLPSERSAEKALRDTNGFVLYDRPLVVQFARSARPKPDSADAKKGPKKK